MSTRASAGFIGFGLGVLFGASAAAEPAEQGPDIALLEYLGDLVDEKGRWVGPDDMKNATDEGDWPIILDDDDSDPVSWEEVPR